MSEVPQKRAMRRGLSALMADVGVSATDMDGGVSLDQMMPIEKIRPNPEQPRRSFDEGDLSDLAASISQKGVIQPLIVRPDPGRPGDFQIVAGERRWRAAQRAGLHEVPVVRRDMDDTEVLEIAIIENIQRSDLNAIEEALGFRQLMEKFGHTQEKLSTVLGKSRSHVANLMRLLKLPDVVQDLLREGMLSAGHARALINAPDPVALAKRVVSGGLSVRETERLAKAATNPRGETSAPTGRSSAEKDADTRALEGDLSAALGLSVKIDHATAGDGGHISVRYKSLDDLDRLCQLLSSGLDRA
ncbi:chromosome partitioning protein, ParB family [Jannaschia faecimaris]|uniref:Chromosome partitioning protein, ParB family n=1 Tax=Jannaschia faecimaris TaxID=1244108 RepID=A0A1H3JIC2_9RHOB|nr:ParB/RepB/Spo0J family partition protein [Jannaschia faecimaris]SDY38974.1 chromosome partitioning protein, ParB family [Jannaschia faecimaris]